MLNMLKTFYGVMGSAPDLKGSVALIAETLASRADADAINAALNRCMLECRYPVRLPDILQRLPGTEAADVNAEKRIAWETLETFSRKYVGNDAHGNFGPDFGWYGPVKNYRGEITRPASYPQLPDRILDTVRRTGGWKAYRLMTNEDYPHQQKRFFEEYAAWTEVQRVIADPFRVLETPRFQQLAAAKSIEKPEPKTLARDPARAPAPAMSPQKSRIMNAIANAGKPMR